MSAYSASVPVTASTMAPSARNDSVGLPTKKAIAYLGLIAASTAGCRAMPTIPRTATATNHTHITGPNSAPTRPVPWRWIANSATRMAIVVGTMYGCKPGAITSRPSTADSTEIAGVIMPSP